MKPLGTGDPLRLGPYRLLGVLGEGGMGKVYAGQDQTGALAAVKVLRPELTHDVGLAQRFVREAHAAQAVRSPGVAAVLGARTEGGRPWIATEFLAGLTLDQAVDTYGPLGEPAVRALAASLAGTLADIHAAGFVHRDLKPPNIVLTSTGPRVIDFGIARPEHGLTLTTTGQIPVTPGYGAPEQVLGRRVAPSADVFSLGAVLVYAATGRRAFEAGNVAAVQYEVVHGEARLDDMPGPLRDLVAPCLAKDPAVRPLPWQIGQAMHVPARTEQIWRSGPLAGAIKERETGAHRLTTQVAGPGSPAGDPVPRRRLLGYLGAGGALLAAGGGTVAWWFRSGEETERDDPFAIPPAVRAPVATLDSLPRQKLVSDNEPPTRLWGVSQADSQARELLPSGDVLLVGLPTGGLAAHDVRTGDRRWTAPRLLARCGWLSLDDRLVVGADGKGVLRTYVSATGKPKWTSPTAEAATVLATDADAVYVVTHDGRLRSVRRKDAKTAWTTAVPAAFRDRLRGPAVVGGGRLAVPSTGGDVLVVRTADGRGAWQYEGGGDTVANPVFSDGTFYINGHDYLEARRASDGKTVWRRKLSAYAAESGRYGPPRIAGDLLYVIEGDSTMCRNRRDGATVWVGRPATWQSPLLPQGRSVWSIRAEEGRTELELTGVRALDGLGGRAYTTEMPRDFKLAAAANRVFLQHDDGVIAIKAF
ncbi:PQQ-binding-like beta-propeller repeat protein [Streptomyces sp. SID5785]|uniref:serine/threonine-protein kinase n=1 Tax=Streptomyces sp. SID5785 TaxID=2690309 RepID=UPI001361218F|nr:serine/threonine-protein kinase [Streptomyces sp. SID5785]MZD03923.1 PQQ-binding-like beta-propeller repeat protein [Streptomyces sp. SID5785]